MLSMFSGEMFFPLEVMMRSFLRPVMRSFPLLEGHRVAAAADVTALEDLLRRVAALAAAHSEVVELDLDPVLAAPTGAQLVDARIRVRPAAPPRPFPALDR